MPVLAIRVAFMTPERRVCVRFAAQKTKLDLAHAGMLECTSAKVCSWGITYVSEMCAHPPTPTHHHTHTVMVTMLKNDDDNIADEIHDDDNTTSHGRTQWNQW